MPASTASTTNTRSRRSGQPRCRANVASAGPVVAIRKNATNMCTPASAPMPQSRTVTAVPKHTTSENAAMTMPNSRLRPRSQGPLNTG